MSNLGFDFSPDFRPLAARMRPRNLSEYIGQSHLLGDGKPLRRALEAGKPHSMLLWGPPGTGKTTLAEIVASSCNAHVERISAVTSGVKEIRAAIDQAKQVASMHGRRTLLFVDEVHRFNKSQQDAFLPHIEDGTVIFIGATTENPSFEVNNALLSRARVHLIKKLTVTEIVSIIEQALTDGERGLGKQQLQLNDDVCQALAKHVDGDARRALNLLEMMAELSDDQQLSLEHLAEVAGEPVARFDNKGDHYYDLISAVHKSVRGSDPDAALYWFARILAGGGDPLYVARRLLAIASEDIGNADPRAMEVALNAWDCFHRVGAGEGERAIAQAVLYLACAPKSNAVYTAFSAAKQLAKETLDLEVPVHLRNAPTSLLKEMGHGAEYRYAHDEPNAYAAGEVYLPEPLAGVRIYQPSERGLEKKISEKLRFLAQVNLNSEIKRYE
ncbi:replication-associated recombination protein A [uncultured Ferrimonas sp.]|uniref:replication-associated recombination protein A n=1 Tax=uncultured Ferrimonas sp. TaxID=432640 RepID=UPI00262F6A60|nr:replication-associated recombination protein A [uncultured Ferrimonas sp.]